MVEGFDAVEINSSVLCHANRKAVAKAVACGKPLTAGSDAHLPSEIGRMVAEFDGDLRKAILRGNLRIRGKCLKEDLLFYKLRRIAWKLF